MGVIFILSLLEKTAGGKIGKKNNLREWSGDKYFSCVLHWHLREEDPSFKLCFSVAENDSPSKGFLNPGSQVPTILLLR